MTHNVQSLHTIKKRLNVCDCCLQRVCCIYLFHSLSTSRSVSRIFFLLPPPAASLFLFLIRLGSYHEQMHSAAKMVLLLEQNPELVSIGFSLSSHFFRLLFGLSDARSFSLPLARYIDRNAIGSSFFGSQFNYKFDLYKNRVIKSITTITSYMWLCEQDLYRLKFTQIRLLLAFSSRYNISMWMFITFYPFRWARVRSCACAQSTQRSNSLLFFFIVSILITHATAKGTDTWKYT